MAQVTHQRCVLELTADMTSRAIQEHVFAGQWKTGFEVVENLGLLYGLGREIKYHRYRDQGALEKCEKVICKNASLRIHGLVPKRFILTSLKLFVLWQLPHSLPNDLLCTSRIR